MRLQYLAKGFYMNPFTGSVDTALGWERDFYNNDEPLTWDEWGGNSLIKVKKNNGEWQEVLT